MPSRISHGVLRTQRQLARHLSPSEQPQRNVPMNQPFTDRLTLHMPEQRHRDRLFELYADPRVWRDDPVTRHTTVDQTTQLIDRWRSAWERDGIGMWVASSSLPADHGELVGIGGCSIRHEVAWNLGFRLRPAY